MSNLNPDIFAAYTGPEGGISSLCEATASPDDGDGLNGENEDRDFVDLDGLSMNSLIREGSKKCPDSDANERGNSKTIVVNSLENDYPELCGDTLHWRISMDDSSSCGSNSSATANQMVSRRLKLDLRSDCETPVAGICNWYRPNSAATGISVSLYEKNPFNGENAGEPVADTFAILARKNSALLVLGDGVNWGSKAALASRCAVYGCIEYLNASLFSADKEAIPKNTQEVFQCLLRSFHSAHSMILREEAQLTTLTACVILPVIVDDREEFVACVCNVGDSFAFVYSPENGHVREITQGSHDIQSNRDMRDALGALGPVDGINPELSNLTCSMTKVCPGDIVFLTSDGISDNFDPVVGKFCVPLRTNQSNGRKRVDYEISLPTVEAYQRHELTLMRMEDVLNHGSFGVTTPGVDSAIRSTNGLVESKVANSAELCSRMVDFCQRLTTAKRKVLEDPELYQDHSRTLAPDSDALRLEQKLRRRRVCEKLGLVPGKLDHATIVAFSVDDRQNSLKSFSETSGGSSQPPKAASNLVQTTDSALRAPHASTEDLTFRDSPDGLDLDLEDSTPTPSESLGSATSSNLNSASVTPVHSAK